MDMVVTDEIPPEEAFELLGHETRLAILYALWEEEELESPGAYPGSPVSFTTLRKRVGMRDGSQFNYHLKKLVGPFVHATGDGYVLRRAGYQIMSAVLSGSLTELELLDEVPISEQCPLCGEQVVLELGTERMLDWLLARCTYCEGGWEIPDLPSGVLMLVDPLEPAGVANRNPDEMYQTLVARTVHDFSLVAEGLCPACSGPISTSPLICDEHVVEPGRVCNTCGTIFEIRFHNVCDVCGQAWYSASDRHFVNHPTVHAFYHEHGYDPFSHDWLRIQGETILEQTVIGDDPAEIETEISIDGDTLYVTIDEQGSILNVNG